MGCFNIIGAETVSISKYHTGDVAIVLCFANLHKWLVFKRRVKEKHDNESLVFTLYMALQCEYYRLDSSSNKLRWKKWHMISTPVK